MFDIIDARCDNEVYNAVVHKSTFYCCLIKGRNLYHNWNMSRNDHTFHSEMK